jgi:hypothetical protein
LQHRERGFGRPEQPLGAAEYAGVDEPSNPISGDRNADQSNVRTGDSAGTELAPGQAETIPREMRR